MKKLLLYYSLFVYATCMAITFFGLLFSNGWRCSFILFLASVISLSLLFCIFRQVKTGIAYYGMALINLFQSFTFLYSGISYKFLIGPNIACYLIDTELKSFKFSFKPYNLIFHVNSISDLESSIIGINMIHAVLFSFFLYFAIRKRNTVHKSA